MNIERMEDFFTTRVDGYDEHMLNNVEGCKEGYIEVARLLPTNANALLDLGCGTGLELDEIFKLFPDIKVTGIDLTQAMLNKLKEKHPNKNINLICANYLDCELGKEKFDTVISFQTMHHFSYKEKIKLYTKIKDALKIGGIYIECDYMVLEQAEEDFYFSEKQRIRKEHGISKNEFFHYDIPCTIENQINLLSIAGFHHVEKVWRKGSTTIVVAIKSSRAT